MGSRLAATALFALATSLSAPAFAGERAWLELAMPGQADDVRTPLPFVEVAGRALADSGTPFDAVLALDTSESTRHPSGLDVDGDGIVAALTFAGRRQGPLWSRWTTDGDDTILAAELRTAQRLLAGLEPARTRAGLVTFAGGARVRQHLDAPERAAEALARFRARQDPSGTHLGRAIRQSLRVLRKGRADDGREQVIVLLSDGEPTVPHGRAARRVALRAARKARSRGVKIFSLLLPGGTAEGEAVLKELAELTGGGYVRLGDPTLELPRLGPAAPLALAEVALVNETTGERGRAVRVFPDGSFDGLVPVRAGRNRLRITAETESGQALSLERTVRVSLEGSAVAALEALRMRTLETELAQRAASAAPAPRALDVRTE